MHKMDDEIERGPYDVRFKNPSSFLLAGASQSGKTTFTLNLLRNIDHLFEKPSCKENVIYFYRQKQHNFKLFAKENIVHKWVNKLPTTADIEELTANHQDTGSIVIIDDFAEALNKDTVLIITTQVNHLNCVVIVLAQNIFCQNSVFREISLNCTYIVMYKNPRDASQINCFAKQIAPGNSEWLVKAFRAATRKAHSYLLFDTHQGTADILRIRSRVLPSELPMCVYREKIH